MKYSVLTSVYYKENPEYLKLSISSMLNQTIPTDDFVIVKDGPLTDKLETVLADFSEKHKNINIVNLAENVGLGAALNAGLIKCKNELVARMDTDDIALENRCEVQLAEFEKDKKLDIVGSFMYEFYDDPNTIETIKVVPITQKEIYEFGKRRNPFNHPTVMYKKSTVMMNSGYAETRRGEDIDLFTRMLYNGCQARNIDKPLLKYRSNADMFKRRKSLTDTKAYISVIIRSWKMGYSGVKDVFYAVIMQVGAMICPAFLGRWIYKKTFRKKYTRSDF
ncbi:glycosyltransferase involved in cell wall biosynthesis [Bacillus fengqiuensis]|nr:glycosyltransferase involved in cell wall biosynthesis [Bacillus fengqiuensis]